MLRAGIPGFNLKKKPLRLVEKDAKKEFYTKLHQQVKDFVCPKTSL